MLQPHCPPQFVQSTEVDVLPMSTSAASASSIYSAASSDPPHVDIQLAVPVEVWHTAKAAAAGVEIQNVPALDVDKHAHSSTATGNQLAIRSYQGETHSRM